MSQEWSIGARIDDIESEDETFKRQDPFGKSWDEVKGLAGLDNNFKRRAQRNFAKAEASGAYLNAASAIATGNEASSKAINPGAVYHNGYGHNRSSPGH
jgi:hypothetical protein